MPGLVKRKILSRKKAGGPLPVRLCERMMRSRGDNVGMLTFIQYAGHCCLENGY